MQQRTNVYKNTVLGDEHYLTDGVFEAYVNGRQTGIQIEPLTPEFWKSDSLSPDCTKVALLSGFMTFLRKRNMGRSSDRDWTVDHKTANPNRTRLVKKVKNLSKGWFRVEFQIMRCFERFNQFQ